MRGEIDVGTWGKGPFDNDVATEWADELSDASEAARVEMLEEALRAAADETDFLDKEAAFEAVAAAAVVATQVPGGPDFDAFGADLALDDELDLPAELPELALRALDRVVDEDSAWRSTWDEADELDEALAVLDPIREALTKA